MHTSTTGIKPIQATIRSGERNREKYRRYKREYMRKYRSRVAKKLVIDFYLFRLKNFKRRK